MTNVYCLARITVPARTPDELYELMRSYAADAPPPIFFRLAAAIDHAFPRRELAEACLTYMAEVNSFSAAERARHRVIQVYSRPAEVIDFARPKPV